MENKKDLSELCYSIIGLVMLAGFGYTALSITRECIKTIYHSTKGTQIVTNYKNETQPSTHVGSSWLESRLENN